MISEETINNVVERLIQAYDPLEIYLFGSYAWGSPTENSDLDLLIVVDSADDKFHRRSFPASDALKDFLIAKDVLVYTKDEFLKFSEDASKFSFKIKNDGRKLYAKA